MRPDRLRARSPWLVLAVGLAARAWVWYDWRAWPGSAAPVLDASWHMALGHQIAGGDLAGGDQTWVVAPGLAYLFALAEVLGGPGTGPAGLLLLALDLGAVEVTRRLGARLGGDAAGLLAGVLAAVSGPLAFHAVGLLGVAPAMVLLGLAALAALDDRPIAAGIAVGLSAFFRPNQLLLWPVLALVAAWPHGRTKAGARAAGAVLLGLALALAPGLVRNGLMGGDWVPISANAGANLYMAQAPGSWTVEATPPAGPINLDHLTATFQAEAERQAGHPLSPAQADAFWMAQAKARIAQDPSGFLQRTLARGYVALATWAIHDHYAWTARRRDSLALRTLPDLGFVWPGLAALGAVLGWRAGRRREVALTLGLILGIAASLAPFTVVERYRIVALIAAIPLSALGLSQVYTTRQWRWLLLVPAVSLALSADPFRGTLVLPDALAFGPTVSWTAQSGARREAMEASNLGAAFVRAQDPTRAISFYQQALALDADRPDDQVALAGLLLQRGDLGGGLQALGRALQTDPRHAAAWLTLCAALLPVPDRLPDAQRACQQATEVAPDRWEGWYQLGLTRWGSGDLPGAVQALRQAQALQPNSEQVQKILRRVEGATATPCPPGPAGIGGGPRGAPTPAPGTCAPCCCS